MKIAYRITLAVLFISTWVSTQGETSLPAKRKRVNFILFLSEPGECVKPGAREDNYLDTFNFQVQNNVKPCTSESAAETIQRRTPSDENSLVYLRESNGTKEEEDCDERLKRKMLSLLSWAREAANMQTAVVSLLSGDARGPASESTVLNKNHLSYDFYKFDAGPKSTGIPESPSRSNSSSNRGDESTLETKEKATRDANEDVEADIVKFLMESMKSGAGEVKKRNVDPFMGVFNVFERINKALLASERAQRKKWKYEKKKVVAKSAPTDDGRSFRPSLLDVVRRTLRRLREERSGYFMIVTGGSLADLKNSTTDFSDALRYVLRRTRKKSTNVILTQKCPKKSMLRSCAANDEECFVPIYVRGPHCALFNEIEDLCDVSRTIRDVVGCELGLGEKEFY